MIKTTKKYGNGTIARRKNGSFGASVYVNGTRYRAVFKTEIEACRWIDIQTGYATPMSTDKMKEAQEALSLLPEGVSLVDAVKFYCSRNVTAPIPISQALNEWLAAKRNTCRPVTVRGYEEVVNWVVRSLRPASGDPEPTIADLGRLSIERLIAGKTPSARNFYLRTLSSFFGWMIKTGRTKENPIQSIDYARTERPRRCILTVEQAQRLLHAAEEIDDGLCLYLAVGMFAGIRPYEMRRLSWGNISNGYIILDSSVTKTASERTVKLQKNLVEWIRSHGSVDRDSIPFYGLTPDQLRKRIDKAWAKVPGMANKSRTDILRHSYASYLYEMTDDAHLVASSMGHSDTTMLFKHYRGLAVPGAGKRFFGILPCRKVNLRKNLLIDTLEGLTKNRQQKDNDV